MGLFIEIRNEPNLCKAGYGCDLCVQLCPVEIFQRRGKNIVTIYDNEDECTLCNLCVDQCPEHAVEVIKQY